MIHYALICSASHEFDGWFASSASFDAQAGQGLVECPVCGDNAVSRALMAPSVPKKANARVAALAETPAETPVAARSAPVHPGGPRDVNSVAVTGEKIPDHIRAALQKLRAEIERNCDYVGDQFAEEARRIHDGDSERRAIYGETTPEQAEALMEDGIPVSRVPWVSRADS